MSYFVGCALSDIARLKQGSIQILVGIISLVIFGVLCNPVYAQREPVIAKGDAIATGFSGAVQWPNPPGTNKVDFQVINLQGISLQVLELSAMSGPEEGRLVKAPHKFAVSAAKIGQVFGVTLDDGIDKKGVASTPSIYATATSAFGLQLFKEANQQIDRTKSGSLNAKWMRGQFGTRLGGGPGSIWKIDGVTGTVSLFADIKFNGKDNTGPALGNIAFDKDTRKLFVSDLQTGLIHSLDLTGAEVAIFDHGEQGRAAAGLTPVPFDDAVRRPITNPAFQSDQPTTWGFAPAERRVWGVAVYGKRVYYAVAAGPEIWSVGLSPDGSFGKDPRLEVKVKAPGVDQVSDITFGPDGSMYLSQRGQTVSSYDYSVLAKPDTATVIRYTKRRAYGSLVWASTPGEYAIGFAGNSRNTNGGVALGYGYYPDGAIRYDSCNQTLWATGDRLRASTQHAARLGTPTNVGGLQGMQQGLVKPANSPPFQSYYVDFDDVFKAADGRGHMGDVAIWSDCGGDKTASVYPKGWKPRVPGRPNIEIRKSCSGAAFNGKMLCRVSVRNIGGGTPTERISFEDEATAVFGPPGTTGPLTFLDVEFDDPRWSCSRLPATALDCSLPGNALAPGQELGLTVVIDVAHISGKSGWRIKNSATLTNTGQTVTVRAGDDVEVSKSGPATCRAGDVCTFEVTVTNHGTQSFFSDMVMADDLTINGTPAAGVTVTNIFPNQGCSSPGGGSLPVQWRCSVAIPPNDSKSYFVSVQIPKSIGPAAGSVPARNCALAASPSLALVNGHLASSILSGALASANPSANTAGIACHDFNVSAANSVTTSPQGPQVSSPTCPLCLFPNFPPCTGQPTFDITSVAPSTFSTGGVPVTFEYEMVNTTSCTIQAFRIDESLPMFQTAICTAPTSQVVPPGPPSFGTWWGKLLPNERAFCSSLFITPNVNQNIFNDVRVDSRW
ncbi:MAG TPA: hypothetical protein VMX97_10355 [Hyphomicrobiaceae bacterium]|nr:hypothetical protein [Hyphomicrobiaceae bacterium]